MNTTASTPETATAQTPAVPESKESKDTVVYQVAGQNVKLSYSIVRNFLTKGNGVVSDQDLVQFISICKYNQLNPFLNEAYLVKYGTSPAQMVVSKEALMKRAEVCPNYDGFRAGIIVIRDKQPVDIEGCYMLPDDIITGGWAEVYRSDRKFPIVARVMLSEYDRKQSTWVTMKSTMIRKVALVQALRESFPTQLGAMYTAEEQRIIEDVDFTEIRSSKQPIIQQTDPSQATKGTIPTAANSSPSPGRVAPSTATNGSLSPAANGSPSPAQSAFPRWQSPLSPLPTAATSPTANGSPRTVTL